jgi:hypothetical protein
MRYISVRADAFGPFSPNATLALLPGLNIIYGLNEAGKSSWHAALYAGLCGIRRGQGRPSVEDQIFAEKHRPWASDESGNWAVTAVLELTDGRRIELRHDLGTRTATIADPATGRPIQIDIMNDGAPDGARLLGLDRRAFIATACVGQADLLRVRDSSRNLQEYLQRAVATGRDDATAVEAMNALGHYYEDFVGSERAPTRPWRRAADSVARLTRELQDAERSHEAHLTLIAQGEDARSEAEAARHLLDLVLARQATREADRLLTRFQRASELQPLFVSGPPPAALDDEELANSVAVVLAQWENRPAVPQLTGATAEQVRHEIDALPATPEGDLVAHPSVILARNKLKDAMAAREQHAALEPVQGAEPNTGGLSEEELRQLSFGLRRATARPVETSQHGRVAATNTAKTPPLWLLGAGALVALGLVLLLASPLIGAILLAGGLVSAAWGFMSGRKANAARAEAVRATIEARMEEEESERVRSEAEARAAAAGLSADPAHLLSLADSVAAFRTQRQGKEAWAQRRAGLVSALTGTEEELRKALLARGVQPSPDLLADVTAYEQACQERQIVATEAARRPGLQAQLEAREAAEKAAAAATLRLQQARQSVIEVAAKCGLPEAGLSQTVEALGDWVQQRALRLAALDQRLQQWTELSQLLDGRSLNQLEASVRESRRAANELGRNLLARDLAATQLEADVNAQVARLRLTYQELANAAAELQGQIVSESSRVPSVPLAEEALAAAYAELDRVSRLRDTINKTREFLAVAQDRVNHDIAPVLNDLVGRRLDQITGGRYGEVRVDPEDLNVRVRLPGGTLQPAHLLSHGTAEQVYLLLRVAMAERLTKPEEMCPLILDDVTVQSDGERTRAILETLLAISAERQVILFSQEEDVLAWAEANIENNGRHQLVRLNGILTPA